MSNEEMNADQQPRRRFFTAPSVERAVLEASSFLETDPENIVYEKVAARGLSRGKGVTIKVDHGATARRMAGEVEVEEPACDEDPVSSEGAASEVAEAEVQSAVDVPAARSAPERDAEESVPEEAVSVETEVSAGPEGEQASVAAMEPEAVEAAEPPSLGEKVELPSSPVDLFADEEPAATEATEAGTRWVDALLDLAELDLSVRVEERGDQVWFDLVGPDADLLLEDSGQILESVQHLLPRLMQSDLGRVVSCVADSNGFREFHLERLRAQAVSSAEAVRGQGRAISLEPMNPPDRRAVHMALADDPSVETESSGRGYFKRITVRPS